MTFLNAWALGFAAIAPLIVLLYLLKLKRQPVTVSTLMFWQRVLQESRRRALFQRLRNLLSLLLHLLIFTLLLGALARPVIGRLLRAGSSTVLILDRRARMQALEADGHSRFEKARALAINHVREVRADGQIAIIATDASPAVVAPFSGDEKPLRTALQALEPTDAPDDLAPAIALARDLLASRKGEHRIVLFTDSAELPAQDPNLQIQAVGTRRDNLAITRFATRALPQSPQTSEVLLEMQNFGKQTAKGNIELSFDGRLLEVKPFELAAGERKLLIFSAVPHATAHARGWLTAHLDTADALAADNTAFAVLPTAPPHRVLLVSAGNWFFEKLLAADRSVAFELLAPEAFRLAMAASFDAVVLDGFVPPGFDLASTAGNFLFLKKTPFDDGGASLEQPLISESNAQHPALRLVNLQNISVVRSASLALPAAGETWKFEAPIRSFEHPLLITGERRGRNARQRLAALGIDVADSDLPLRIAFPLLISNTLGWLAGDSSLEAGAFIAGETIPLAEGQTLWTEPQREWRRDLAPKPENLARHFFQPLHNGFYQLSDAAGARWIAVNTFSAAESELRGDASPDLPSPARPTFAAFTSAAWPLWQYLAFAALLLFTLEWWLFHRRRTE